MQATSAHSNAGARPGWAWPARGIPKGQSERRLINLLRAILERPSALTLGLDGRANGAARGKLPPLVARHQLRRPTPAAHSGGPLQLRRGSLPDGFLLRNADRYRRKFNSRPAGRWLTRCRHNVSSGLCEALRRDNKEIRPAGRPASEETKNDWQFARERQILGQLFSCAARS